MGRWTLLPLIGLGPHSSKKKQDLDTLHELRSKARQIMNQFGPSALINLSSFSSIKPEPANTLPEGSMANTTTVGKIQGTPGAGGRLSPENNQVLTKKKLQDLMREVDPLKQLDEDGEEMLLQIYLYPPITMCPPCVLSQHMSCLSKHLVSASVSAPADVTLPISPESEKAARNCSIPHHYKFLPMESRQMQLNCAM